MVEVFVFLAIFLLCGMLLLVLISKSKTKLDKNFFVKRWREIESLGASSEIGLRHAVTEADKLLDHALKSRGFRGETMGERLKSAANKLGDANAVWSAHKLRNHIAHEAKFKPSKAECAKALNIFKKTLKKFGAL
jgi:hypothetical protein